MLIGKIIEIIKPVENIKYKNHLGIITVKMLA